ncbi:Carbohydrate acetyl esterase/feruloyl esterase precursor [Rubripirellula lacrimiformis]|uniref:Carbohydrate acetyl esterase/feruloyl esterase n=1 Tax=Rubripirellula lacrimiformis TaxID=1930273 RepID=A0A517N454_9BACT|nr:sialate O-acetylesterase [Rubripirellula lacrimiformis]QDT01919.1 Carbohydrate acetyl esterase/feruloyl esterase precursor [Rubripirellula lacrimiformis]
MLRISFFPRVWIALGFLFAIGLNALPTGLSDDTEQSAAADAQVQSQLVPQDPESFHLFILAGQSNMAGRGKVSDADRKPNDRVLSLGQDKQWTPAVDPLHFDKPKMVGVGIGRSFAAEYAKRHPGITVGLIPCAVGGSAIDTWQPGGYHDQTKSHPWDDMQSRVQQVAAQGVLKGVLWHQGESDSSPEASAAYESNLTELIQRFRQTFDAPQLPFLIGQLGQFAQRPWTDGRRQVDAAQQRIVQHVARTAFVPSDGLNDKGDLTHFDSPSLREFGFRYAAAMQWIESLVPVQVFAPGEGNPRNSEGDFVRLADGQILFVYSRFESGVGDHSSATLVSRVSDDGGATWTDDDVTVVENEGGMNVMSVSLLRLADNRIALFYLRKNSLTDCRPVVRFSSDEAKTWSEPTEMIPEEQMGYYVLNNDRVIQLTSGRLVAPVSLHRTPGQENTDWLGQVGCYFSDDAGSSWQRSTSLLSGTNADGVRVAAQEPGVVERRDGSLLMWIRSDQGTQYQSHSFDQGLTWSAMEPFALASPLSPASIERVPATGDLMAVWNDHEFLSTASRARTPLSLAVSSDDGATWSPSIPIAADPHGWYCYTAMDWVDDTLLLGHVDGRQEKNQELATSVIRKLPLSQIYTQLHQSKIESLQRIGDASQHNAFTDLLRFQDRWYCVYRVGSTHVSADGALQILVSDDGTDWSSAAVITHPEADLRDAKLTVTPGGELMLSGAGAFEPGSDVRHQSMAWFSKDGQQWSDVVNIGPPNYWLWRTTWNGSNAYSIGYHTGKPVDQHVSLFRSQDEGRTFLPFVERTFDEGYPNESSILFGDDGHAICLLRRDGGIKTALLGKSMPPYDQWTWTDTGTRAGGPHIIRLPDGRIVAAVRLYDTRVRTSLCWLNPETGELTEFQTLPSGGDCSYPGLAWHDDQLWVSYYSAHEVGKPEFTTAVYLARVRIPSAN